MPPKRSAAAKRPADDAASTAPKKTRKPNDASEPEQPGETQQPELPEIPRNPRWAPVSVSANIDKEFQESLRKLGDDAFKYVLMCTTPFSIGDDGEDEDDEDEDEDEEREGGSKPRCDAGKTCLCDKPASEYPEHPWKITVAAKRRFFGYRTMCDLRCPDNFGMYTFNDHAAYGVLEVVQNLFLDHEEASNDYRMQWSVCETMAYFLNTEEGFTMTQADDGDGIDATFQLAGRIFLTTLARLERENLLSKDSKIENLGSIMALFMLIASHLPDYGLLEDSETEPIGPKKDKKSWAPHTFPDQILAYARKYDIELVGPKNLPELIAAADPDADLPTQSAISGPKADPFGLAKALKSYKYSCGGAPAFLSKRAFKGKSSMGGDALDLTSWTSAERKKFAFDKKDPLGPEERESLKRGEIMMMA